MPKKLNERVLALREQMGLTQQDFAALCGLTNTSLSRIENGQVEPQNGTIKKIIDRTGVDPVWLVEGKGELKVQVPVITNKAYDNIYQDALYKELKEQASIWQQKYNDLFGMFSKVIDRTNLGKFKAPDLTALLSSSRVSGVRVDK